MIPLTISFYVKTLILLIPMSKVFSSPHPISSKFIQDLSRESAHPKVSVIDKFVCWLEP